MNNDISKSIVKITYEDLKNKKSNQGTGIIFSLPDPDRDVILTAYHVIEMFDGISEQLIINSEYNSIYDNTFKIIEVMYKKSNDSDLDVAVIYIEKLNWFFKEDNMILAKDFLTDFKCSMKLAGFPSLIKEEELDLRYLSFNVIFERFEENRIMVSLERLVATPTRSFEELVVGMSGGPLYFEVNNKRYLLGIIKKIPGKEECPYYFVYAMHVGWYLDKIKELYGCDIPYAEEPILIMSSNNNIDSQYLDREWFNKRLRESISNLRERYSEELDVPVSEEGIIDYICFTEEANKQLMFKIRRIEEYISNKSINQTYKDLFMENVNSIKKFLSVDIEKAAEQDYVLGKLDNLIEIVEKINKECSFTQDKDIFEEFQIMKKSKLGMNRETTSNKCINEIKQLKEDILLMTYPYVLVTGNAGIGKSHFIAHCAKKHFENMGINVLILGNLLVNDQPISAQIKQILDIDCSIDAFLNILDMYGRYSNKRSLIFFDGLNECNNRWKDDIMGFIKKVESYPWIGIIMSLRSGIDEKVEKQLLSNFKITKVELKGFSNIDDAISKFSTYYKVPINRGNNLIYILNTPLLLKLYFKSYSEQEAGQPISLKSIINAYIRFVNEKICTKKGYSSKSRLTKKMLNVLVDIILETGKREVDFEDYEARLNQLVGIHATQNNLIDELIGQNILSYFCNKIDDEEITIIFFEYELLGDFLITERLLEIEKVAEFNNESQLERFFSSKSQYAKFISDFRIREMLAVLLPDLECKYDIGGFEIQNWPYEFQKKIDECMFFNYLRLRNPKKINLNISFSFLINNSLLFYDYHRMYRLFDLILELCIFEEHCYSVIFFEKLLRDFTSAGFHREWTVFTSEHLNDSDEFRDILYLAMSQKNILNKNEKKLLGMTLAWCLVSLDEKVITTCEDALLEMYKDDISGLTNILKYFSSKELSTVAIIVERLLLVSMHCMFTSRDFDGKKILSNYIIDEFSFKDSLFHKYFMIHKYAMYIFDYASELGIILDCNINSLEVAISISNNFNRLENFDVKKIIKTQNLKKDDYYIYDAVKYNENEMHEFEDYYKCHNNVVYSLMSLYTDVKVKYNHIYFKSEEFIDLILPEYREIFCKKVIRKIIDLGYNYIKFGFYDLFKDGEDKYIARIYERMAFNIVFMEYINSVGDILWDMWPRLSKKITYEGLWALTYYEKFDISSIANQFNQDCEEDSFNYNGLLEMIEKNKFIRINSSFNSKVTSYIVKTADIDVHSIIYQSNVSAVIEGIYFSEIFVSKRFYNYFELLDEGNDIISVTREYLWDYEPFTMLTIINPVIYKEMNLTISEDKMCYYYNGKLICKNTIKETGNDELLIENEFLKDFLSKKMYSIMWVFEGDRASLESKNIIVKYDGKKIRKYYG